MPQYPTEGERRNVSRRDMMRRWRKRNTRSTPPPITGNTGSVYGSKKAKGKKKK